MEYRSEQNMNIDGGGRFSVEALMCSKKETILTITDTLTVTFRNVLPPRPEDVDQGACARFFWLILSVWCEKRPLFIRDDDLTL